MDTDPVGSSSSTSGSPKGGLQDGGACYPKGWASGPQPEMYILLLVSQPVMFDCLS